MQIFLDDEREPVNSRDFVIVRNYLDFVNVVLNADQVIEFISFDHDLGDDSLSGYECAKYLVELDMDRRGVVIRPWFKFTVHGHNPDDKYDIEDYLGGYIEAKMRGDVHV
jgi:hypothetical protein